MAATSHYALCKQWAIKIVLKMGHQVEAVLNLSIVSEYGLRFNEHEFHCLLELSFTVSIIIIFEIRYPTGVYTKNSSK